ncbi:MAG TPA: SusC/RagA family TonB-linked outer membrane protein [Gemmatimonadaceae bacterium]|nr:SusC/RagA family TonB-linked outer membrane protein [Gemmatimonadaceae bacterium]
MSGVVTTAEGALPITGATVSIVGTNLGAITREGGAYTINAVPAGLRAVQVRLLGFASRTDTVMVAEGATTTVNFALVRQAVSLEGMVVVGYGTQEAEKVTGAVATVTPDQFNTGRVVSAEELIQGKVPGVQVVTSGEPGGGVTVRVRGGTSINASNEPLYVVDGVPLPVGGGLSSGRNPLNFLNPDDIESITVLKDASATAIYGSRGANGVVLVETKGGAATGPRLEYTGSISQSQNAGEAEFLTAAQFRTAVGQHASNRVADLGTATTDWRDAVLRNATGQEHNVAFSGMGENMNYRLSLGYLDQAGVVLGSATERASVGLNYSHSLFNNRLNVSSSLRGARTEDQYTPGGGLGAATIWDPTQPIYTDSGYFESSFELSPTNPVAELDLGVVEGTTYRTIGNLEGRYELPFLPALTATTRVGFDVANSERRTFLPTILEGQRRSPMPGYLNRSNPRESTSLLDMFLTYDSALQAYQSEIEATAGYSFESSRGDYPYFEARGLSTDLLGPNGVPAAEENRSTLSVREGKLASFFGRVNYTMQDKYTLMLSVRRDGSSRFGPDNQWGTFPAAAVAWRIGDEPFLADMGPLSELKLRASWGVNGNQAVGDYLWLADYRYGDPASRVQFGNEFVTTIRPSAVDPNIKWEETTSWNLGADYGFWENRVNGSVEYYNKRTDDLLFRVPVAAGTFVSNYVTTNIGSVRNTGVELTLNADVLEPVRRGLTWNATFNAARNSNELLSINPFGGGGEQILVGAISGGVGSNIQVLQPGFPVNSFFVYEHKRDASGKPIYSNNELEMYVDADSNGVINQNDRRAFKSPAPDWIFGHTSRFGYGNADLSFTLRAQLGNHVYNNVASSQGYYNRLTEAAGPVNLHASVLENGFERAQFFSDVYVEDASFLRMDNITLGYTLPSTLGVQRMRIFGTVQNAFTMTGYSGVDPIAGLNGIDNYLYPRSRTFSAGVNVGF